MILFCLLINPELTDPVTPPWGGLHRANRTLHPIQLPLPG